jgi:CheY-like chemotaxis protein/anti-sigma regulatory factor (Ser/Thr protein kinase)
MTAPNPTVTLGRVLAVDDDIVTMKLIQMLCQKFNYDVLDAASVPEAQQVLTRLGGGYFSCILTDYRMPGQTGLDLYEWVKDFDPTLSAILLTAEGEKKLVASSLRAGFIDFLEKPVNPPELQNALFRAQQATEKNRGLGQMAREVTEAAITQKLISGVSVRGKIETLLKSPHIRVCLESPKQAGGDFLTVLPQPNDGAWILVGDVSGHDLRAAFLTAYFQGTFRALSGKGASPEEVFNSLNSFLTKEWPPIPNVTPNLPTVPMSLAACSMVFDASSRKLTVTNAGLPCPLLCEPEGIVKMIGTGSPPLGWMDPPQSSHNEAFFLPGARIWQWSDGLEDVADTEEVDPLSIFYSILYGPNELRQKLLEKPKDDVLLLAMDWADTVEDYSFLPFVWQQYLGHTAHKVDSYQRVWEKCLSLVCPNLSEVRRYEILLCTREAVLNGFAHGCEHSEEERVVLTVSLRSAPATLRVRVDDPGDGHDHDPSEVHKGKIIKAHCGLFLIQQMTSRTMLERSGATLVMDFDLDSPPSMPNRQNSTFNPNTTL